MEKETIFFEIHRDNPREGPGSYESTWKAYSLLKGLPEKPVLLDAGCGPGKQTLDLARISPATIQAIDIYDLYLTQLNQKIRENGLVERIFPKNCDMGSLTFPAEYFDVIWAEGSIYNIGFEKGLTAWKKYLKPGGYIAVTEASWLKKNPPQEVKAFWNKNYPSMLNIEENLSIIRNAGYTPVDYFILPERDWWDEYYNFIEFKLRKMEEKYFDNPIALEVINLEQVEIDLFRKHSDCYGYVFYIMQYEIGD